MKKRMMLILALGLSFAPPALAATQPVLTAGEELTSQVNPLGIACGRKEDQKARLLAESQDQQPAGPAQAEVVARQAN